MSRILSSKMAVAIGASALLSSAATFAALSGGHRHPAPEPAVVASFVAPSSAGVGVPAATFRDASVPEASSVALVPEGSAAVECF